MCNANPDCTFDQASMQCTPDIGVVETQTENLKKEIDALVDQRATKECTTNICIDKSSGFKKTCKRILEGNDAQQCPPGFASLPIDEDGIQHNSPPCDNGGPCAVCTGIDTRDTTPVGNDRQIRVTLAAIGTQR